MYERNKNWNKKKTHTRRKTIIETKGKSNNTKPKYNKKRRENQSEKNMSTI